MFLRVLEYYEGILFLTTNRVGDFDEAFISRIHMALYYPALNWQQTANIWKSHIRRAKENSEENAVSVQCEEQQLLNYAEILFGTQLRRLRGKGTVWNGRQIRNGKLWMKFGHGHGLTPLLASQRSRAPLHWLDTRVKGSIPLETS